MEDRNAKKVLVLTCLAYLANGIITAAVGPLLSQFASNNNASLAEIGGVYSALFVGALLANMALGRLTDRWGQHRALIVSLILYALAMTAATFSRWLPLTFGLIFVAGLGYGTANLCGNVLVGRVYKERSVSAVNWLNVFYGIGAFTGPLLVSLSLFLLKDGAPAIWFGAIAMLIIMVVMILQVFDLQLENQAPAPEIQPGKRVTRSIFLWTLSLVVLIYVGTEATLGGWSTTYLQKTTSLPIELAAMGASAFWLALTGGRLMGALIGSRISEVKLLILCLAISFVGALLFLLSYGNGWFSVGAILTMGLGFGAIYPTIMAVMTNTFRHAPGQAGGVITAMGSIGGSLFPWLLGVTLQAYGMRSGTYYMSALVLALILAFVLNQQIKKTS
jgi:FHS family Na+ dependent glucose MFS transporter 1